MGSTEQDRLKVEQLYGAWLRAESRWREAPLGSPEATERLAGVEQLWLAYEDALAKAVGRGSLETQIRFGPMPEVREGHA